jgi:hypothetical protein
MKHVVMIISLICITGGAFSQTRDKYLVIDQPNKEIIRDTVRVALVVYAKIPGFMYIIDGFSVRDRQADTCITHMKNNGDRIKLPRRVWDCTKGCRKRE